MSVNFKVIFCTALVVLTYNLVSAQAVKSPFSSFGIGDIYGNSLVHNQGMGGVGYSQPQFLFLNNQNPALLPYNLFTVFQAGVVTEEVRLTDGTVSGKARAGNLNYLAIAFPLKFGKAATSLGIKPYSRVNYSFSYEEQVENSSETFTAQEEGTGGLSELYWNNGFKINQYFNIGISTSYIFGNIVKSYDGFAKAPDQALGFRVGLKDDTFYKGFSAALGLSFTLDSLGKKNNRFNVGAVCKLKSNLNSDLTTDLYMMNAITGDTVFTDRQRSLNASTNLPSSVCKNTFSILLLLSLINCSVTL